MFRALLNLILPFWHGGSFYHADPHLHSEVVQPRDTVLGRASTDRGGSRVPPTETEFTPESGISILILVQCGIPDGGTRKGRWLRALPGQEGIQAC